eukprot:2503099-Rhodomonas_salina.1
MAGTDTAYAATRTVCCYAYGGTDTRYGATAVLYGAMRCIVQSHAMLLPYSTDIRYTATTHY